MPNPAPSAGDASLEQLTSVETRMTENALLVLKRRYLRRGPDGQAIETVEQMFRRVILHVARVENQWGTDVGQVESSFYDLITALRFLPNSPTFTGAGTPLNQLAACFVLPVADDMGREDDGIFQTLRNAALIQQSGGGTGFSFSRLRSRGSIVRSSGGQATGPVGFMRVFNTASEIVSQGGARRGANMAVLRVDHPDISEFVRCKRSESEITNFNLSVAVSDAFMRAVEEDTAFDLISPQDEEVRETVRARDIFEEIVAGAHQNGEPGLLFLDTANRDNPCPHLGQYEATNPCGEQFLLPYESCCLGSVDLAQHVSCGSNGHPFVDWEKLRETVELGIRFLDDVIDANGYVDGVPQLEKAARRSRRIGLGLMGFGDLLYILEIPYGSEDAQEFAAQMMEYIRYHAMRSSIELARERGPFPAIRGSIYDPDDVRWTPPRPLSPYRKLEKWGRPPLDWESVVADVGRFGIRNAAQTTIAPTGTIGSIAGCEAYGCEPVFALVYTRHMNDNGNSLDLRYTSPLFLQALERCGLDEPARDMIVQQVAVRGSCQGVDSVPSEIQAVFKVAGDIPVEEHVRMQAAFQAFVDASISKTINFPSTASPVDVAQAFLLAWRLGCKGLTVYVTGSRQKVVLETEATHGESQRSDHVGMPQMPRRTRPHRLAGMTYRVGTPLGRAYVTVNTDEGGEPFEVFLNIGKAGSDTAAVAEAIGRLISLDLTVPSPLSSTRRLHQVVRQLKGIGGGRPLGFGRDRVRSLPDGVAQVLAEHLGVVEAASEMEAEQLSLFPAGDLCPECGHAALASEEGCRRCYACGYSEC